MSRAGEPEREEAVDTGRPGFLRSPQSAWTCLPGGGCALLRPVFEQFIEFGQGSMDVRSGTGAIDLVWCSPIRRANQQSKTDQQISLRTR